MLGDAVTIAAMNVGTPQIAPTRHLEFRGGDICEGTRLLANSLRVDTLLATSVCTFVPFFVPGSELTLRV